MAPCSFLVYCTEKLPSASINPLNQLLFSRLFKGNLFIYVSWFLFNQSINLYSWCTLGVLNWPLIILTIFFKPTTGETTKTQALSLGLYFMNPDFIK